MNSILSAGVLALIALSVPMFATADDITPTIGSSLSDNFWSGGVGVRERANAPEGNVKVVMARNIGPYLADLDVVIEDEAGEIVKQMRTAGPWVIGNLEEGRYRVVARRNATGEWQGAWFSVDGGTPQTLHLVFKQHHRLD